MLRFLHVDVHILLQQIIAPTIGFLSGFHDQLAGGGSVAGACVWSGCSLGERKHCRRDGFWVIYMWFIMNSCGESNDKSSTVITIFIGGVVGLPFPVMAGKNDLLLPTLQNYRFRSLPARIFGILNAFHILNLGSRIHPIPSGKFG